MIEPEIKEKLSDSKTIIGTDFYNSELQYTLEIKETKKIDLLEMLKDEIDQIKEGNPFDDLFAEKAERIKKSEVMIEYLKPFVEFSINQFNVTDEDLKNHIAFIKIIQEDEMKSQSIRIGQSKTVIFDDDETKKGFLALNLGFLYKGYKPEFYYWEIVIFSRKFILIFLGVFNQLFPLGTKITWLFCLLFLYYFAHRKFEPYTEKYLNDLETISLTISIITIFVGILLLTEQIKKASIFLLAFMFFINLFFVLVWLKDIKRHGNLKEKMKTMISSIRTRAKTSIKILK